MDIKKVFQFRDGVRFFDFDESSFIIDTSSNDLYNLGKSSALISANLDGKNNLGEIMEIIRKSYNVSLEDSTSAVTKFITVMQQKSLIEELD